MDNEVFLALQRHYSPLISNLIASNVRFYRFNKKIRWQFTYDEKVAVFACYSNSSDLLSINICSVAFAFEQNEPLQIEYFLLHEIRHIFQFSEMSDFKNGLNTCIDANIVQKWISENENYAGALNKDGSENQDYFKQDMEFDAYAFAYAVMKYKYGEIPYLYKPSKYGEEFDKTVESWCQTFQLEKL